MQSLAKTCIGILLLLIASPSYAFTSLIQNKVSLSESSSLSKKPQRVSKHEFVNPRANNKQEIDDIKHEKGLNLHTWKNILIKLHSFLN